MTDKTAEKAARVPDLKPFLANIKITNANNSPYSLAAGLPDGISFDGFKDAIVKSFVFPGKDVPIEARMVIFQESFQQEVTIIHATYHTEMDRVIHLRSKEPGLFLTCVLRGGPEVQWGDFEKETMPSGFFNLIYSPKNNQCLSLKPGCTEILEFHYTAQKLEEIIREYGIDFTRFKTLMDQQKCTKYHEKAIAGEPKQLFLIFYLLHNLKSEKDDLAFSESMAGMATDLNFEELLEPTSNIYRYIEVEEFGRIILNMHRFITIKNIWQREIKDSFLTPAQFKKLFLKIWNLTPDGYVRDIKLTLAKNLIIQGVDLFIIMDRLGYATEEKFNADFKAFHGEGPEDLLKKFDGAAW